MDDAAAEPYRGAPARQDAPPGRRAGAHAVFFAPGELARLTAMFSRMLQAGAWRDYSIDHTDREVVFRVYRRSREAPDYALARALRRNPGREWQVRRCGRSLRRSRSLDLLIAWVEAKALGPAAR